MLETFLINILFMVFPVLLFVIFFDNYKREFNYSLILFSFSISMILCMIYPIELELGFIIDLRYIAFIIAGLYGGYKGLFPLYLLLNVYRFIIGGEGTLQSFVHSTLAFIVIPLLSKRFNEYNPKRRIIIAVIVSTLNVIIYLIALSNYFDVLTNEYWSSAFFMLFASILVMSLNMVMIEKIISNIKNRENHLRTERLHVMSELSASVTHEIRNPLTVTKGFLQLLNVSKTISTQDKVYIDYSLKELLRAESILSDYLAFSKPQSEHMVYSNLKEDMEYVQNVLSPFALYNKVEIVSTFSNSLKKEYDQNQIKQCFINLMKNGIEAMKGEGGTLYVDVTEQGNYIMINIKDCGVGMTKDEILHLGKPYYSNKKEGTGLGMLLVYGTISKMKGKIDVQSKKGVGTTFTITIPT
ncbi:HAMP domain-containing sensor histidine kinase [Psychrobacillus sp. FJAT-51614]|uniref:histidine kinase n=1 Tax=Psychrobacillus mangrovi TaxID=3117745 RepID=A0ABU8F8M0_9BACI